MHGLKQLVYDNQPFFSSNQTGKTNRELYILWKQNKRGGIKWQNQKQLKLKE